MRKPSALALPGGRAGLTLGRHTRCHPAGSRSHAAHGWHRRTGEKRCRSIGADSSAARPPSPSPRRSAAEPSRRASRRSSTRARRAASHDRPAQVDPGRRQLGDHRPLRQARRPAPLAVPRDARRAGAAPRDQLDELGGQQDLDVPAARGRAVPQGLRRDDVRGRQVHLRPRHRRGARGRGAREVHQHREHRDRRPLHGRLPPDAAGPAVPARRAQRLRRLRHEQEGDRGEGRGSDQHRSDRHRRLRARDRAHRPVAGRHARRQRRRTGTRRRSRPSCRSSTSPTRPRGRSRSCRATST